jgi:undecaprenyl-diphosphatase
MALLNWLNNIDTQMLLGVNGNHSDFFDAFFTFFTSKETWFPFYVLLLVVVFSKYKLKGIWVILTIILAIVLSDQISVFIKDAVQRLRPSHVASLYGELNLPIGKRGSYGFVSSHASNSFALAVVISMLSKSKRIAIAMLGWAILVAYSRVYVGVHFPFDVITGAILGGLIGWGMVELLTLFDKQFFRKKIMMTGA